MSAVGGPGSAGMQVNRYLDALGYPDKLGDAIGALVDMKSGNVAGAMRNLVDLKSGLTTRQMDNIFGRGIPGFGRGFCPRCTHTGRHLIRHQHTYTVRQQVGKRAHIGQRYGFRFGPFRLQGRISGRQYIGSFAKPTRLLNGQYLYRGRTYPNLGAIYKDARDGRIDGQATRTFTRTQYAMRPGLASIGQMLGRVNLNWNPASILGQIFNQPGGLFGGIPGGIPGMGGGTGASGGTGSTGGPSVLSNPNLTMEDKLALLMAKLSQHLDQQIEEKMKAIETAMKQQQSGQAGGKAGAIAGGAAGAAFGGPLGGTIGTQLGSQVGQAAGQDGGTKPNLQLLQTQLQQLLQKRQQMFQTMSAMMKSLHDTSMNAIRNLKA